MSFYEISSYLNYLLTAKGKHGTHSPFVYDLLENVLDEKKIYYTFREIEERRKELLKDNRIIEVTDLGAGSKTLKGEKRKIRDIAKSSLKNLKYGQILYRLALQAQPKTILELGTSLGVTTLYLAKACPGAEIHTFEGCPNILRVANEGIARMEVANVNTHVGHFESTLPDVLNSIDKVDLAFVDGHHLKEPTINYTHQILDKCHEQSVVVLDDIHWSKGMKEAWNEIRSDERVVTSIDLFEMGLLFFDRSRSRQHFVLRP